MSGNVSKAIIENAIVRSLEDVGIILDTRCNSDIDLLDEGITSLEFINFILGLEEILDIFIPDQLLTSEILHSFNGLVALLEQLVLDQKSDS